MKRRNGWLIRSDPDRGTITITLLGCLLGGCAAVTLYALCVWQLMFWSDYFGLRKDVGSAPAPLIAAERPA